MCAFRIVYDLKFVGPLDFKLVAPMPEQLKTWNRIRNLVESDSAGFGFELPGFGFKMFGTTLIHYAMFHCNTGIPISEPNSATQARLRLKVPDF